VSRISLGVLTWRDSTRDTTVPRLRNSMSMLRIIFFLCVLGIVLVVYWFATTPSVSFAVQVRNNTGVPLTIVIADLEARAANAYLLEANAEHRFVLCRGESSAELDISKSLRCPRFEVAKFSSIRPTLVVIHEAAQNVVPSLFLAHSRGFSVARGEKFAELMVASRCAEGGGIASPTAT